jgi:hypothetical protein
MASKLPALFPLLPQLPEGHERWSPNVLESHRTLSELYRHAKNVASQEDLDPLQVAFHVDSLTSDAIPILVALGSSDVLVETPLPEMWIISAAELLGDTVAELRHVRELAKGK